MSDRRDKRERDLDRELRDHLELEAAEHRDSGLSAEDARYAARRAFGNTTLQKEAIRDMWSWTAFERIAQDLRFGLRTLRKNRGFAAAVILTLGLGIGAASAIFSVMYGVLLRDLPYPDADRVALVHVRFSPQNRELGTMSTADYLDWRSKNTAFEDPAIYMHGCPVFQVTATSGPFEACGTPVTDNFFAVLRSSPIIGTMFRPGDSKSTATPGVVLSEPLWRSRFGANRGVVGQVISLSGSQAVILGVMPASFRFPATAELWTNLRYGPPTRRGPFPFIGIGRLKPGITFARAQAETNAIGRQIELDNPGSYRNMSMPVLPLRQALTGNVRPALLVLFGAVSLLLLIAIVNVASLMFVRANAREREMAVRLSLGAGSGRLIRQLLTESLLLASGGGVVGLAIAWWGVQALQAWKPGNLPRIEDVHLDLRAVAFTVAIAVLSGIVFGLAPALRCSRTNLNAAMKSGGKPSNLGEARRSAQRVLAAAEVALSCTLLIGGGLELHSLLQLDRVNAGYQAPPEQVLSLRVSPSRGKAAPAGSPIISRYTRLLERASSLPGVASAALTDAMPPGRSDFDTFQIDGQPWSEAAFPAVTEVIVSPEYFRTLQVPLLRGRYFTDADLGDAPRGIIISESLARRYFRDADPIGRQMAPSSPGNHNAFRPIIGVVADVKYTGLDSTAEPAFYRLYTEFKDFYSLQLAVRSTAAPSLAHQLERVVHEVDPGATMSEGATLASIRSESESQPRFRTLLIASFGGAALLLSAIGVYGVIAFSVAQRTNEIGIRMALGARRGNVLRQVLGSGAMLGITGTVIGSAGALLLTRVLRGLLFGTSATEPVVFASVALLLVAVAVVASLVPAIRAIRIDPKEALRYE